MQATPKHAARIRWPDRVETAENSIPDDESQQILHISNFRIFGWMEVTIFWLESLVGIVLSHPSRAWMGAFFRAGV